MADDNSPVDVNQAFNNAYPDQDVDAAFTKAFTPAPSVDNSQPVAPPNPVTAATDRVNVVDPQGNVGSLSRDQLTSAMDHGYKLASDDDVNNYAQQQKYGGLGQQAIAGLEGAAEGVSFGTSTLAERALGVDPADIRGRAEANPTTHDIGQVAGLVGSAFIPGVGEANILKDIGEGGAAALGLGGKGAGFVSQVGADAVKGAFEATLFQGGDELSKAFSEDPNQTAETAAAHMGLATILGGVFGGGVGAALRGSGVVTAPSVELAGKETPGAFVSELDRPAMDAGDFKTTIQNSDILTDTQKTSILDGLKAQKPDADEITAAAERLNAPVMEGMTSASPIVQKAEDSLINGAPTYSGLKRQELYSQGYNAAKSAVEDALGDGSRYTKAELGNILKKSITDQISEQNEPIAQMYDQLKQAHETIPLAEKAGPAIARDISEIKELKLSPSSPEGALANRVMKEVQNLKTVDDVKTYKSILNRSVSPTASSGEKRMASVLSDKLTDLEENSIERFAKQQANTPEQQQSLMDLIGQRKVANSQYKDFIGKVKTLSEQLGKGRVYGVQDAKNFINDLTPESITQKLFSKNNSEFLNFFQKEYPEQMQLMQEYQKGSLREAASRTGELSPKLLFNSVNKLEPEIQKSIFQPQELQKLNDAETYLRAFPKNFNPSGTSGMSAFRAFFEHPAGAAIANVRDFGIEKFIKAVGNSPEIKQATALAKATTNGWNVMTRGVKSIFNPDKATMPASIAASVAGRNKLSKLVDQYSANPQKLFNLNDNNPVPSYGQAFAATSARAVQYLAAQRPDVAPKAPLDTKMPPSSFAQAGYNRALDIAQTPMLVLKHMQDGTLTPKDITTLNTIYPNLYKQLSQKLQNEMIESVNKGQTLPYQRRLALAMFTAQPLDSTMTPQGIMSAQPMTAQPPQAPPQGAQQAPKKGSPSKVTQKLPKMYQTTGQAAEEDQSQR